MSNLKVEHKSNLAYAQEFLATMKRRGVERKDVIALLDEADAKSTTATLCQYTGVELFKSDDTPTKELWWQVIVAGNSEIDMGVLFESADEQAARQAMDNWIDVDGTDCALSCNGHVVVSYDNGKFTHHEDVAEAKLLDEVYAKKKWH